MVIVSVQMRAIVAAVDRMVQAGGSQSRLMVTERWVAPSRIPTRYVPALARLNGVEDWTTWSTYPGYFAESRQVSQQAFGVATRPDNLVAMHPGLSGLDPAAAQALTRKKKRGHRGGGRRPGNGLPGRPGVHPVQRGRPLAVAAPGGRRYHADRGVTCA